MSSPDRLLPAYALELSMRFAAKRVEAGSVPMVYDLPVRGGLLVFEMRTAMPRLCDLLHGSCALRPLYDAEGMICR